MTRSLVVAGGVAVLTLVLGLLGGKRAGADDLPSLPLDPETFELLPLDPLERDLILAHHEELARTVQQHFQELAPLLERFRAGGAGNPELRGRIEAKHAELHPLLEQVCEILAEHDVDARDIERARRGPRGALREMRYAHSLVLRAPDLSEAERSLFARVVPALDGALLSMDAHRRHLRDEVAPNLDAAAQEALGQVDATFDARSTELQRRFWILVDNTLSTEQKAWVRDALPTDLRRNRDVQGHLSRLPGLTGSQAARLRALFTEVEQEVAADQATIQRLERELREGTSPEQVAELRVTRLRTLELQRDAARRAKAILDDDQYEAFRAIPPLLSTADREQRPEDLLRDVDWQPHQHAALLQLRSRYEQAKRDFEARGAELQAQASAMGPDSPQMEAMRMRGANLKGEAHALVRELLAEVFLEVMSRDQVLVWLLR